MRSWSRRYRTLRHELTHYRARARIRESTKRAGSNESYRASPMRTGFWLRSTGCRNRPWWSKMRRSLSGRLCASKETRRSLSCTLTGSSFMKTSLTQSKSIRSCNSTTMNWETLPEIRRKKSRPWRISSEFVGNPGAITLAREMRAKTHHWGIGACLVIRKLQELGWPKKRNTLTGTIKFMQDQQTYHRMRAHYILSITTKRTSKVLFSTWINRLSKLKLSSSRPFKITSTWKTISLFRLQSPLHQSRLWPSPRGAKNWRSTAESLFGLTRFWTAKTDLL